MTVIERVKEWVFAYYEPDFPNLISRCVILRFLKSLEAERCVWRIDSHNSIKSCQGTWMNKYWSIYQQVRNLGNTKYCPDCGKQIEVKEEGNG